MGDEQAQAAGEGAKAPQDPAAQAAPQDPAGGEGAAAPQDPQAGEGTSVNRHQYERDIANRDARIKALEAELGQARGAAGDTARLSADLDALKAQIADERVSTALASQGCVNAKAARALLGDYEGDVSKLKEACPYLFGRSPATGATGGRPAGPVPPDEARTIRDGLRMRKGN